MHEAPGLLQDPALFLAPVRRLVNSMPIAAAVTFGSFGDIVTIIQLVAQLCAALNDVAGAPTEIQALFADLNGYMLVLTATEDVLLQNYANFEPRTRVAIEGGLARCMRTLLAIQRHVDAFAARVRPGHSLLSACAAAVRWRLLGMRREVAALHARLDKQLSFVQMCLGVSQSKGQRALHDSAERNGVLSERILMLVHTRPPQSAADASVLQVRNGDSDTVYPAFAVVPLHTIGSYLAPLFKLLDPKLLSHEVTAALTAIADGPEGVIAMYDRRRRISFPVFDCAFFSSRSGERHVALGVPPLLQNELVTRMLSDVLHGEFYANADAGMYAEEENARFVADVAETYNYVLDLAQCSNKYPQYREIIRSLERFPDLTSPTSLAAIVRLEDRLPGTRSSCGYRSDAQGLRELSDLVSRAPALAECSAHRNELKRLTYLPRIAGDAGHVYFPRNPALLLFHALAKRPGSLRLSRAYRCAVGHIGYDLPDPDAVPHLETLHPYMTAPAVLVV